MENKENHKNNYNHNNHGKKNKSSDPNKLYNVVAVMFEATKKKYYFEVSEEMKLKKDEKVIVDTARGKEIGIISNLPIKMKEKNLILPLKPVLRKATEYEAKTYEELKGEAKRAAIICREKIDFHKLEMKLITSEITFDKSKMTFYFTANGRVDFRELVKDLASSFRTRIELRQIGVRDEARILGDVGPCGKELCCKTFLNKFDSVSVKMARDQGLVINPTKISGVCGRLLCCINYEFAQYEEALRKFPAVNQKVKTEFGEGKVVSISPLNEFLYVYLEEKGITRFDLQDITFNLKEAHSLKNIKTKEEKEHRHLEKD
ncbi:MAG: stage 0 sporulation family protein [Fusobacterium sp.]|nr:stage 0 sporulation family protein [Fusobacterium sp.]